MASALVDMFIVDAKWSMWPVHGWHKINVLLMPPMELGTFQVHPSSYGTLLWPLKFLGKNLLPMIQYVLIDSCKHED